MSALALGAQKIMPLMNVVYTNYTTAVANSHQLNEAISVLKDEIKKIHIKQNKDNVDFKNKILIKDVSFRYRDNLPYVISNINFEIKKGSKIGIIGKTGVGKSTLLDIVMGLLITSGNIYVDDKIIDYDNSISWRKNVTHVPQDIFLTNGSILENIALGVEQDKID